MITKRYRIVQNTENERYRVEEWIDLAHKGLDGFWFFVPDTESARLDWAKQDLEELEKKARVDAGWTKVVG